MRIAILLGNRAISPHHHHFVAHLRRCAEVVGGLSFRTSSSSRRLWKQFILRRPLQVPGVVLSHLRFGRVTRARREAFRGDQGSLEDIEIVDVGGMEDAAKQVAEWRADVLFQFTAGIIREPLLSATPYGVLSFHHGIMPLLRGLAAPFWAIYLDRPDCLGITLQRLAEKLDAGTILAQSRITVNREDAFADIVLRLDRAGAAMIVPAIEQLATRREWIDAPAGERVYRSRPTFWQELIFPCRRRRFCRKYASSKSAASAGQ